MSVSVLMDVSWTQAGEQGGGGGGGESVTSTPFSDLQQGLASDILSKSLLLGRL